MKKKLLGLATGLFLISYCGMANATLMGNEILVARQHGDMNSLVTNDSWNVTVSNSLELDDIYYGVFDIDINESSINISFNKHLGAVSNWDFNGLTFSDVAGTIDTFMSLSLVATNVVGFGNSFLAFQDDNLFVDLSGLMQSSGQFINIEVGFGSAPVPEPTTMLLLGSGLIGLARVRRRFSER